MGKISLEVRDEDLLRLGEERLREEIDRTIKWLKMKELLKSISEATSSLKIDYESEIERIKREAWQEHKKDLPL